MPPRKAATKKKIAATKAKSAPAPKKVPAKRSRSSDVESDASSEVSEPEAPAKRVKTDTKTTTAQATKAVDEKPDFGGKFDLYNMSLDYLCRFAHGETDYEAIYIAILEHQEKSEFSAQVAIPKAPYFAEDGAAKDPAFCIEDMDIPPFPLLLKYIRAVDTIGYTDMELNFFPESDDDAVRINAPGLMADLKLARRNPSASCCSGKFLMHRCWMQTKGDGSIVELFEGYFDVSLSYGKTKFDGHACSADSVFGFWAVRARKDENGEEIGVELGDDEGGCFGF
ncbi:uncharacterized protein EV420DRAFT_1767108 [Desarmillaria tabescens]|uniref:Uncharacterized protein n=1 Tax=Armillaria tabescens TaxID=1929756 RepID=A0AA39JUA4_ARMTA|nr:uncharacterized protein EV420DRAFT_1767108 [Desarmillaria tabescens]KAK0449050.1 hypothetical protein EV420DRAFT_1767108 [Desarmillaria tabescens]